MFKHNKKRNVGLLGEFFARYIAQAAVEFREKDMDNALSMWRHHMSKNSEMIKELQLFESLYSAHISDRTVAYELMKQVKKANKALNQEKLDREKTNLLHEINKNFDGPKFFSANVTDYKTNATIQILLNAWRDGTNAKNLADISLLENQIIDHITFLREKPKTLNESMLSHTKEDIDGLVVNIFREKMEKKYGSSLNESQRNILGLYVFSNKKEDAKKDLINLLENIKNSIILSIDKETKRKDVKVPMKKLLEIKKYLNGYYEDVHKLDNDKVTFYMAVAKLKEELESEK